ncbi:hypothetical protein Salat_1717600 [Sesamum alatum]|uniref:Myb/SANT-like domain-containing protein n=1 Tax=Sesamum alatum TaxID=300844 RepID=A0AAE2CK86_9LAMI|nr:hypothetical protein Salat_1717600 [Sesamum alatum]
MLYQQALHGHKQVSRTLNIHSLSYAHATINNGFGWHFLYNVIKDQLEQLRKRYNIFHRVMHTPGFMWNRIHNEADPDVHRIFDVSSGEEENIDEPSDGVDSGDEDSGQVQVMKKVSRMMVLAEVTS